VLTWKKAVVCYFKTPSRNYPGENKTMKIWGIINNTPFETRWKVCLPVRTLNDLVLVTHRHRYH
jgi:hypothetical protein